MHKIKALLANLQEIGESEDDEDHNIDDYGEEGGHKNYEGM